MTSVGVVIVTHNSEPFLAQTLRSVLQQSQKPDDVVIVDDSSTDQTRSMIQDLLPTARVFPSVNRSSNRSTRIAQNFLQGVRASKAEIVILGDHDDVWSTERVSYQSSIMRNHPSAAMAASSATLIDEQGRIIGGTLRGTFPVPNSFMTWPRSRQVTFTIARSIATGGVSVIRPGSFASLEIPDGWLHDRWWSLAAVQQGGFILDDGIVAQYRVMPGQEVGLQTHDQGTPKWILQQIVKGPKTARKAYQVAALLLNNRR